MPSWVLVIVLAVVFTAVMSVLQGLYWVYVARQEQQQAEILRRLGGTDAPTERLFVQLEDDAAANSLGSLGAQVRSTLASADVNLTVTSFLLRCVALGSVVAVIGGLFVGLPGMMVGFMTSLFPYFYLRSKAEGRAAQLVAQLPDAMELMSRSLQAGLGLNDAFRLVAEEMPMPISAEFGRVFEEVRFGRDYRDAFANMVTRYPNVFDLRLMVSSILLQRETGGNLIEILENIAETIRSRFVFQAKVRAMTAEARISAAILGSLPLGVMVVLSVMNPDYLTPLFNETLGNIILGVDACLYTGGILLMRDLSKVEV